MRLEKLVQSFFQKENKFYDKNANLILDDDLKKEYEYIKSYLSMYIVGDKIAILLEKDYRYVVAIFVCFELGLTIIPLNKEFPKKRIDSIIEISNPNLILTNLIYDEILSKPCIAKKIKLRNISSKDIAYIIFTSGSTGQPKGVMIRRESYCNFILWVDEYFFDIQASDIILNTADFTFDLSFIDLALLLSKNLNFYISNFKGNIFYLMSEIEDYNVTTMATVPNNFQMLLIDSVYERGNLSSLKHLLIGGARFSYGLYLKFKEKMEKVDIYNLYGPTEATVYCCVKKLAFNECDYEKENISVGKEILNSKVLVVDEKNFRVEDEVQGKLLIGGIQVMQGYINNEIKNKETLLEIDGKIYYDTGDLAFKNRNNDLFIVGRLDDSIKVNGYRINLSDLDSNIQKLSYLDECCTIAIKDTIKENIMITFVKTSQEFEEKKVFEDLIQIMPSYQLPQELIFIKKFPLNTSGKICKKQLKEEYKNRGI